MNRSITTLSIILLYFILSSILFVQRKLSAGEEDTVQSIITQEHIIEKDRRAMLRAFYTAPPVIPHEVESEDAKKCLECHLNVTRLEDDRIAMQTPHPEFSNCMQCHVRGQRNSFDSSRSQWQGLEEPRQGDRWFTLSPPTVPHRIYLRENCLSCHGPQNPDTRLRTTHPHRTSCLQCHIPNYDAQF